MRHTTSTFFAALLAAIVSLAGAPAHAEIIDRIVARVNGEIVTMHDVRQAAVPYMLQNGMDPSALDDPAVKRDLYEKVLDDVINRKLIVEQANEIDLEVSEAELEQWLALTRQQQGLSEEQFKQIIKQYGMKFDVYREMVRENLLRIRLVKMKVASQFSVSEEEVDAVYRERYGEGVATDTVITVAHILIRPSDDSEAAYDEAFARAERAKQRIDEGEEFADVAADMSDGPTAPKGGKLGTFGPGELDPEFEKAAFELEPGKVSDIVQTKFGYHVILVSKRDQRPNNRVQALRDRIHAELQQQTMQRLLAEYTEQLRNRAFVEVKY